MVVLPVDTAVTQCTQSMHFAENISSPWLFTHSREGGSQVGEMAVKVPATKPDKLSSIPRIHTVGENQLLQDVL